MQEERQPTESDAKIGDEGFKASVITMLNEVKENMLMVNKKTKILIKKDTTKKIQMEIIKLKSSIVK